MGGFVLPFFLAWIGIRNTAPEGEVPQSVILSFYAGAAILLLCVVYSLIKIKEWPPKLYEEYNGIPDAEAGGKKEKTNLIKLLRDAPSAFWTVSVVQFFCWFSFLFMWTYTTGTVASNAFDTPEIDKITSITDGDNTVAGKYILVNDTVTVIADGCVTDTPLLASSGDSLMTPQERLSDYMQSHEGYIVFTTGTSVVRDSHTGKTDVMEVNTYRIDGQKAHITTVKALDTASSEYSNAGDWVGILFAVQAVGSVLWAVVLPRFRSRKFSYSLSLLIGAVGFVMAGTELEIKE